MGLGFDGGRLHQEPWGSSQYFFWIGRRTRGDGNVCWRHFGREMIACDIFGLDEAWEGLKGIAAAQ